MIFVDSSVWVGYFRGTESLQTRRLDELFGTGRLVIGDLILTEVLQGCLDEREFDEALSLFNTLPLVRLGGYALSVEAAHNFRKLRAKGFTVRSAVDSLIATSCISNHFELLHDDRDFVPFERYLGLKCVT